MDSFSKNKVGLAKSVKLKIPEPLDSKVFEIPSLSRSKSMLSIIPSLSKSSAQTLTVISAE